LLWFLSGETNIKYLVDNNVHIRDDWPYAKYSKKMKSENKEIDLTQKEFITKIKEDSDFGKIR
jgi:thymidylate synthase